MSNLPSGPTTLPKMPLTSVAPWNSVLVDGAGGGVLEGGGLAPGLEVAPPRPDTKVSAGVYAAAKPLSPVIITS